MPRWHLACDACATSFWIGRRAEGGSLAPAIGWDAWCEACQESVYLPGFETSGVATAGVAGGGGGSAELAPGFGARDSEPPPSGDCPRCGRPLTLAAPRFEEIFGALQNLAAVLAAWDGDAVALRDLLPERPRFLGDLDPPAREPGDDALLGGALEALAAGAYSVAQARLAALAPAREEARVWRALAIACERRGDTAAAEAALTCAIARSDEPVLRLQRGTLRARRGDVPAAAEDFARSGDRYEAGWNRAALTMIQCVADSLALPDAVAIAAARREAGPPSGAWSDHTIGRLLWSLLIERAEAAIRRDPASVPDPDMLRAAERELEFDSFWDRAMVLEGYARLGLDDDAARIAAPLALELARRLAAEPSLNGEAAAGIGAVFEAASHAISHRRPGEACDAIVSLLRRDDLRRYRVPCRRCGQGSLGVAEVAEEGESDS